MGEESIRLRWEQVSMAMPEKTTAHADRSPGASTRSGRERDRTGGSVGRWGYAIGDSARSVSEVATGTWRVVADGASTVRGAGGAGAD
ncbi:MAG: hypothetical protein U5O16_40505 [Rhodococcus sp. (in: high G+C Gram-positive bacteria)]|uniref:hypothetical protein n=1 Tax=Rhodococcus sp. TaxID=1831 RepID=UPI002AD903AC|nr:hypothetical protein [Rhodococcus sp. (in: high G+C Gram-positive bacteria)]